MLGALASRVLAGPTSYSVEEIRSLDGLYLCSARGCDESNEGVQRTSCNIFQQNAGDILAKLRMFAVYSLSCRAWVRSYHASICRTGEACSGKLAG